MAEFRKLDKSSSRKIAKEVCWEVMSAGRCRRGWWPGSTRPPRGESRGAGTAHAQRRASALQRADHRGLSERVPVAFTWSKLMTSEGRSSLAGDFVGARSPARAEYCDRGRSRSPSPASGLHPPSRLSRFATRGKIGPSHPRTTAGGFVAKQLPSLNRTQTETHPCQPRGAVEEPYAVEKSPFLIGQCAASRSAIRLKIIIKNSQNHLG